MGMKVDDRKRRVEAIRKHADQLHEIARRYERLRWMAEEEKTSTAFLELAEAAGDMTVSSMQQLGTLLAILWRSGKKESEGK